MSFTNFTILLYVARMPFINFSVLVSLPSMPSYAPFTVLSSLVKSGHNYAFPFYTTFQNLSLAIAIGPMATIQPVSNLVSLVLPASGNTQYSFTVTAGACLRVAQLGALFLAIVARLDHSLVSSAWVFCVPLFCQRTLPSRLATSPSYFMSVNHG
jgi:hypothetical protein